MEERMMNSVDYDTDELREILYQFMSSSHRDSPCSQLHKIITVPGGTTTRWYFIKTSQIELDTMTQSLIGWF